MDDKNNLRLLFFSLIIGLFNALFPVMAKIGKGSLTLIQFTFIWYFLSCLFYLIYILYNKYLRNNIVSELKLLTKLWRPLLSYLILNTIAIFLLYYSLNFLQTNTFTFLLGSGILFNILISLLVFKEIANLHVTLFSILLIIIGFTFLRFTLSNLELTGIIYLIGSTFLFSITNYIIKSKINIALNTIKISNVLIGGLKSLFIMLISLGVISLRSDYTFVLRSENLNLVFGAFAGPFVGYVLVLKLLREFGLGAMVIYKSSEYGFASILGILFFGQYLSFEHLLGIIFIISGIIIYNHYQTVYYNNS